jgi:ribulose-phosphate 3-epimerase
MIKVAPSILSADFADMKSAVSMLKEIKADMIHCDVMDGMFVPNITFGMKMVADIRKLTDLPLDVHLMIVEPERYIEEFCGAGADILTLHAEATNHLHRALQKVKACGSRPGVVLNPATPVNALKHVLPDVDFVLLMSVNPGYGGQVFIPQTLDKIKELRSLAKSMGREIEIEIDGGINEHTSKQVRDAGADILVAGNAIFTSDDPAKLIRIFKGEE